ncbi:hypothetical protein TRVL_07605 [Trypanosoma vivax]|nr:hypothetical protein TRVL_07605 [Trypanosoma vivax]
MPVLLLCATGQQLELRWLSTAFRATAVSPSAPRPTPLPEIFGSPRAPFAARLAGAPNAGNADRLPQLSFPLCPLPGSPRCTHLGDVVTRWPPAQEKGSRLSVEYRCEMSRVRRAGRRAVGNSNPQLAAFSHRRTRSNFSWTPS